MKNADVTFETEATAAHLLAIVSGLKNIVDLALEGSVDFEALDILTVIRPTLREAESVACELFDREYTEELNKAGGHAE